MRDVFLDRDGVINFNRSDHVKSWEEFEFLPGALEAIARLNQYGYRVFVITNQAIVNRGLVTREILEDIHSRMTHEVRLFGGEIEAVLYCPHLPEEACHCRKPRPGMIEKAVKDYGARLEGSWLVGDHLNDIYAGHRAGCRNIMVMTGRANYNFELADNKLALQTASDLPFAVNIMLRADYLSFQVNTTTGRRMPDNV